MVPGQPTAEGDAPHGTRSGRTVPLLESKLTPHVGHGGGVPRTALLDRLEASSRTPVVAVTAPPGYGKTMLLAQWAGRDPRPFAWVSIDQQDNDPTVLLTYLATALDRVEPVVPAVFEALASPGASTTATVLRRLWFSLAVKVLPVVVVLDDVHRLQNWECLEVVAALAERLPPGSQLVVAGRGQPPPPATGPRLRGRVLGIGPDLLAMDHEEAGALLREAEVDLSRGDVEDLVRRTEGWPVALYLAALSFKSWGHVERGEAAFTGDDRFLVDYLQTVLLSSLPPRLVSFLTRTSVLDRMSGPLCDAVLGGNGSASLLESLERSSMLVVRLERQGRSYRYHHLFRELLRAELERREPAAVRQLAQRAAEWCERNGPAEAAVGYAMAAGDAGRAARLVVEIALHRRHGGGVAALERWFDWFDRNGLVKRFAAVTVLGAWTHALAGRPAAAERWADAAEQGSFEGTLPDGSGSIDGWLALLRAVLCRDGPERMRADAEIALRLVPSGSPWRATAHLLSGLSHLLAGDLETADRILADAAEVGRDAEADAAALALAERCILAMARGDWRQAGLLSDRVRPVGPRAWPRAPAASVLLDAVAARVALHRGEVAQAHADLARAQRSRLRVTYALPVYAVQTRLELARAHGTLADAAAARAMLREADELLQRRPDLGTLRREAVELHRQLDAIRMDAIGASTLTAAELRLLRLLGTHHSFRGMGEQLHLSRHTVKSHAMSIYRKLDASSRSEAIQRARDLGLLEA
ncbi:MAG TPA: AAA family ATPase [Actinomycetes bacterium]|nr:AAA family ATPase [Actinomycetes bacterium]